MPDRAKLTSLEALESFRTSLIIYLEKALRVLDEINDEVLRTKFWVQNERREHWEREVRRCAREFEQRQQELFSARLSTMREPSPAEHLAALKAKRALDDATARLNLVKKWERQYENRVEPLAREADKLRDFLHSHMGKAVAYLAQATTTLSDYAELSPPDTSLVKNRLGEPTATDCTFTTQPERGGS
jgi:vacuolar-type H+-ATPase subunit E/Vma4